MDTNDRPLDRSTSSLNDPLPHTPAAAAMRDALPDTTVRPDTVHPHALDAATHRDHLDDAGTSAGAPAADRRTDAGDANPGDEIGEAVGGISGVLTGAAIGSLGGPIGTIIGGIAGAVSGWWAGRAISDAAYNASQDDEEFYRGRYADSYAGAATSAGVGTGAPRSYDDVRPAYQLGHLAGRNPDYQGRSFDEVEADLRHGWTNDVSARYGSWEQMRGYARDAFERSRATATNAPGVAGPGAAPGGAATGLAATGGAAGTPTGGTATQGSAAAPASGALDDRSVGRARNR